MNAMTLALSTAEPIADKPAFEDRQERNADQEQDKKKRGKRNTYFQIGTIKMEEFIDPRTEPWTETVSEPGNRRRNVGNAKNPTKVKQRSDA